MSKKRRERANQSEHVELGLSASTTERIKSGKADVLNHPTDANESNTSDKAGLLAYVKNPSHWWVACLIALFALGAMGAGLKYLEESAQKQKPSNNSISSNEQNNSFLSTLNPFAAAPSPTPTPLPLSKEYVYAGSRMLAVEDAGASAAPPADLAYWRPGNGNWYVMDPNGGRTVSGTQFGLSTDLPMPGDYDGDGKTDFAVFRPSNGVWYMSRTALGYAEQQFGSSGDKPMPADYDGDGKTDLAIFRPSTGYWYFLNSTTGYSEQQFASSGDIPASADFDGDGKADIAVWRPSNGTWYMSRSTLGYGEQQFGQSGDTPVQADYDGDGKADHAIRRGADWYIRSSSTGTTQITSWQLATDVAVHNDYDGDGKVDIAVWRSAASATWYIKNSSTGLTRTIIWGTTGDIPVPAFYRR